MPTILAVGIATLDVINTTERYPAEDDEVRAIAQRVARGGNAANTLDVLAQLGHHGRWLGVLADDADAARIAAALTERGIDYRHAPVCAGARSPVSYITVSRATGSRTIVHHRDLPELAAADFAALPLDGVDWLHFEGRNVAATRAMIRDARARAPQLPISVELEKPRPEIHALAAAADVAIYARAYAQATGHADPEGFLAGMPCGGLAFCAWGADGGWLRRGDGTLHHEPAWPPAQVVDTVGAGDCFNAGLIDALSRGQAPERALRRANQVAGAKCGQEGFAGLARLLGGA
ncbi:MAG: PfkB family carbohydrate kinase [Halorhodospira halophila]|uniref:PfkB family carbohydrate kinase n=1 Tax=Halorhodospira TaxID=85108 RepID=UPI0019123A58|nr:MULTISPECIES: PfkB family carbohydrate kinase [Halorhodospira]MBK5943242.1 hypothetical protein [Halorhodospira halophila]MCC3751613.1 PfkB family carbohydrate kinase [Halorhodospira halophila]MCG5533384.1 PfkB family carbohydrate kinase [Halorhodospira sp. 9621]